MKRNITLDEISDGRLYGSEDMAKLGCNECLGCSACCRDMGRSIILDPLDIFLLCKNLHKTFEMLLSGAVELNVVDGIILPNLKMLDDTSSCAFLNSEGRCSVHDFRPGICRLFPLGRYYEDKDFKYFLQTYECKKENRTKVKIKKWLQIPDLKTYERYICDWHGYLMDMEAVIEKNKDETFIKKMDIFILELFYLTPYDYSQDFYGQFNLRLKTARQRCLANTHASE